MLDVRIGLEEGSCVAAGYTEDAGQQQPPEPSASSSYGRATGAGRELPGLPGKTLALFRKA